jgi:hypothetical protein
MGSYFGYFGDTTISEEKRAEYFERIRRVLELGGMMRTRRIPFYNREIWVLDSLKEVKDVEFFDYNYFEDSTWESAGVNLETGKVEAGKVGSKEFARVMAAAYVMMELYTEGLGAAIYNRDFVEPSMPCAWFRHLLGGNWTFEHRFDIWNYACVYAKYLSKWGGIEEEMPQLLELIPPRRMLGACGIDLVDFLFIINGTEDLLDEYSDVQEGGYDYDVLRCKRAIRAFLDGRLLEEATEDLLHLLSLPYEKRKVDLVGIAN